MGSVKFRSELSAPGRLASVSNTDLVNRLFEFLLELLMLAKSMKDDEDSVGLDLGILARHFPPRYAADRPQDGPGWPHRENRRSCFPNFGEQARRRVHVQSRFEISAVLASKFKLVLKALDFSGRSRDSLTLPLHEIRRRLLTFGVYVSVRIPSRPTLHF